MDDFLRVFLVHSYISRDQRLIFSFLTSKIVGLTSKIVGLMSKIVGLMSNIGGQTSNV